MIFRAAAACFFPVLADCQQADAMVGQAADDLLAEIGAQVQVNENHAVQAGERLFPGDLGKFPSRREISAFSKGMQGCSISSCMISK